MPTLRRVALFELPFAALRPGKRTKYRRVEHPFLLLPVQEQSDVITDDAKCDGLFAMVTNAPGPAEAEKKSQSNRLTAEELLAIYKYG